MIRHGIFRREICKRKICAERGGGGWQKQRPRGRSLAQAISALAIAMIEAAGQAALMPLPRRAALQGTRARATSRTAITLPVIARRAQKKLRATRASLAETLPEGFDRQPRRRHRASPQSGRQPAAANGTMAPLE